MKIRELLQQAGISEQTYYSLMRQHSVSFMRKRPKGYGNFGLEHVLAMKAFALLRAHGLGSKIASAAVDAAFPAICDFASEGQLVSPEAYRVGARLLVLRGVMRPVPLHDPVPPDAEELGRVELDLRGVAALVRSSEAPG